jgi:hypothetical protein
MSGPVRNLAAAKNLRECPNCGEGVRFWFWTASSWQGLATLTLGCLVCSETLAIVNADEVVIKVPGMNTADSDN